MKLLVVSGSNRKEAQSLKVSRFLAHCCEGLGNGVRADVLDLGATPLPMWDENIWAEKGGEAIQTAWAPIRQRVADADGYALVSPEWAGMVPSVLKNFLLFAATTGAPMADKPVLLVGVSAGTGGAYPIAELRASGGKNNHFCIIPEHLIVRQAGKVMNELDRPTGDDDVYIQTRAKYAMRMLVEYARALTYVRAAGVRDLQHYPYGM